jgi:hypothetical protein
VANVVDKS